MPEVLNFLHSREGRSDDSTKLNVSRIISVPLNHSCSKSKLRGRLHVLLGKNHLGTRVLGTSNLHKTRSIDAAQLTRTIGDPFSIRVSGFWEKTVQLSQQSFECFGSGSAPLHFWLFRVLRSVKKWFFLRNLTFQKLPYLSIIINTCTLDITAVASMNSFNWLLFLIFYYVFVIFHGAKKSNDLSCKLVTLMLLFKSGLYVDYIISYFFFGFILFLYFWSRVI
ncbi:unnamed protein product [Thelazia callipaeda]|uniref:Maturase K n=1 Tax=Thelazia callipaeda TaxID=103827 RepID=A0A0N5CSD9_THECL|nr:unnamed protein product [Thelazia callipaeda]